jgi:hypothetical protein
MLDRPLMTDLDPRDMARSVVLDGLRRDTPLFVALQYLGLVDSDALHAAFPGELVEPAPESAAHADRFVMVSAEHEPSYLERQLTRSAFARWMEGEGPWDPEFVRPGRG